jgi:hypothetical protein
MLLNIHFLNVIDTFSLWNKKNLHKFDNGDSLDKDNGVPFVSFRLV